MTAASTVMLMFAGALVLAVAATPLAKRLAIRLNVIDHPTGRKLHTAPVPTMGGIAIATASIVVLVAFRGRIEFEQLGGILLGGVVVAIVGALDDRWSLSPLLKLSGQLLATGILVMTDVTVRLAGDADIVNVALTALWVVAVTNAFNLLDNMDGLLSGVAAVAAVYFTLAAAMSGQSHVGALAAAVLGAALGFLLYNFNPATIFMGDSGSLFLGFVMAAIGIKLRFPDNVPSVTWMVPVLVLIVPLFDTGLVVVSRIRRRLNPFTTPGKDHTSHRLVAFGHTPKEAVMIHYLAGCAAGSLAIFVTQASTAEGYVAGGIAAMVALAGIVYFERRFARISEGEAGT